MVPRSKKEGRGPRGGGGGVRGYRVGLNVRGEL